MKLPWKTPSAEGTPECMLESLAAHRRLREQEEPTGVMTRGEYDDFMSRVGRVHKETMKARIASGDTKWQRDIFKQVMGKDPTGE